MLPHGIAAKSAVKMLLVQIRRLQTEIETTGLQQPPACLAAVLALLMESKPKTRTLASTAASATRPAHLICP